MSSLLKSLVDA